MIPYLSQTTLYKMHKTETRILLKMPSCKRQTNEYNSTCKERKHNTDSRKRGNKMFVKANINWSVKQFVKMYQNKTISVKNIVQRSFKWEKSRMSLLIHSLLSGYPVPPFYAKKGDNYYDLLDGKQRLMAMVMYLLDEYGLIGVPPVEVDGEMVDINGKKFSELSEELQDIINAYSLTVYYFDGISDEEVRSLFKRLNNGKPLTSKEKAIANCTDIATLSDIGEHEFFSTAYTEKALEQRKQIPVIMKMHLMLIEDDYTTLSFLASDMEEAMEDITISDSEKVDLVRILDKALAVYNLLEKKSVKSAFARETNLVSLTPFLRDAINMDINDGLVADFITDNFSSKVPVSEEYNGFLKSGGNHTSSIVGRHRELTKAWDEFFAIDAEDTEEVEVIDVTEPENGAERVDNTADVLGIETNNEEYRYGMKYRGFPLMDQPMNGLLRREDDIENEYFDILVYNRKLTDEEVNDYELEEI